MHEESGVLCVLIFLSHLFLLTRIIDFRLHLGSIPLPIIMAAAMFLFFFTSFVVCFLRILFLVR